MKHWSLFSWGWGFDVAAEMMWWTNVFHCENNPFCQKILKNYWPNAISFTDIITMDGKALRWKIDVLTGGFPCQPFSTAGKRKGTEDTRYLWPQMLRVIKEIQPSWVIWENVYGLLSVNEWAVFNQVHIDLEREGYTVWAYVLPATGINAPHRRYRIWFVAYAPCKWVPTSKRTTNKGQEKTLNKKMKNLPPQFIRPCSKQTSTNTIAKRLQSQTNKWKPKGQWPCMYGANNYWQNWPTQSPICSRDDGLPLQLDWITFSKRRKESIKLYGNAIVPQIAFQLFKIIERMKWVKGKR
jgi:DNA (cytosine-5)-methyltransferase 1